MIVMLNGSFGVGKTTVAKALCNLLPSSRIYDPEWAGLVLMRLPKFIKLQGSGTDDFQDLRLWRRSVIAGTNLFCRVASGPVIVPMTFSRREYFDEIVAGLKMLDTELSVFCLKASLPTIKKRLMARGDRVDGRGSEWISRRILECIE